MTFTDEKTGKEITVGDPSPLLVDLSKYVFKKLEDSTTEEVFTEEATCYPLENGGVEYIVNITDGETITYSLYERANPVQMDHVGFIITLEEAAGVIPIHVIVHRDTPLDMIHSTINHIIDTFQF